MTVKTRALVAAINARSPAAPPADRSRSGATRELGSVLWKKLGAAAKKRGFEEKALLERWSEIVGPRLAAHCAPVKLERSSGRRAGGVLHLRCTAAASIELRHLSRQIVSRVNAHFGRRAVAALKLRSGGVVATSAAPAPLTLRRQPTRPEPGVDDPRLALALGDLGAALRARLEAEPTR